MTEFVISATADELAEEFCRRLEVLAAAHPGAPLALTGGNSAAGIYRPWAVRGRPAPEGFEFYWSDERLVPLDDADSNFKQANDILFLPTRTPPQRLHPAPVALPGPQAAAEYIRVVRGRIAPNAAGIPRFPLILLGLGEDGHTGSLFPGRDPYADDALLVRYTGATADHPHDRLTFTPALINAAAAVWFIVTGAAKAGALHEVARRRRPAAEVPALVVDPAQVPITVFADRAAAQLI